MVFCGVVVASTDVLFWVVVGDEMAVVDSVPGMSVVAFVVLSVVVVTFSLGVVLKL